MEKLTVIRHFRCSEAENKEIARRAEAERKSQSAYIRDAVLDRAEPSLPGEAVKALQELTYNELKIGTNINQAVRLCNSKKFVSSQDYRRLTNYLQMIMNQRLDMISLLNRMAKE